MNKRNFSSLKLFVTIGCICLILTSLAIFSSVCFHEWTPATCTTPETCTKCGKETGTSLEHEWQMATCRAPKTCSLCNTTEGNIVYHAWSNNKCVYCQETKVEIFLGKNNAFTKLYSKIPEFGDDYQLYLEDMVLKLCDAITSKRLGSREAQIVISGLIPKDAYSNKSTNDAKMDAIYNYFVNSKLVNYFTLWFDNSGNAYKCKITEQGIKNYVNDGINCKVFTGTWDSFTLNPSIKTLEDFCKKMNVTHEVAVGFFAIIDTYSINWLSGESSQMINLLN